MPRVLVVLPTDTYRASDFVAAADALGVELSIASDQPPPLGLEDRFVPVECGDPESSAERLAHLASTTPVDAIVAADDAGVLVAALASERLGLPHNPPSAARATLDKASMRRALARSEVPQPRFAPISPEEDPRRVLAHLGTPAVVKPVSLAASRGVIRVDDPEEGPEVVARIRRILGAAGRPATEQLLAEEFLPGPEVAVEGILWNGELETLAVFDKPDPLEGPYFEETMYVTPSRHPESHLVEVERVTARAAAAIGLAEGPVHAELRLTPAGPKVVEVAARTIGGLCGRSLTFGLLDTPLEVMVLRHALGMRKESLRRSPASSGVMMLPIQAEGRLRGVRGREAALAVAGITSLEITIPAGGSVVPLPEGDRYLGFLFARASSPEEVERALRQAHARLDIRID